MTTDAAVEQFSRWTAARTTRRSFLHRLGQLAVLVAAGPTIAGFLLRRAEARVCGQTGVTPKCDTFDCAGPDDVWGWCWYASDGCCRNDGLKKICDCCTVNYPNVHGYCPSGTNVRCIVESCGTDPRLLHVTLTPVTWELGGYTEAAIASSGLLANQLSGNQTGSSGFGSSTRAVIAPEADAGAQLIAAPLAGTLGAPLLTAAYTGPSSADLSLLVQLGVSKVLGVGPLDAVALTTAFGSVGIDYQVVADDADHTALSIAVAAAIGAINDINRTVTIANSGLSAAAGPLAAAFAAVNGFPIALGSAATAAIGQPTLYVGPEPSDAGVPSERTSATTLQDLSIELADMALTAPLADTTRLTLAPEGSGDLIDLVNLGTPILLHPPGLLGPLEQWIQDHTVRYGYVEEVFFTRGPGELTTEQYWHLQSAVNGFRVDQLMGRPGDGLPVFRQPYAERPIGMARTDGALPVGSVEPPSYWTDLGQTLR